MLSVQFVGGGGGAPGAYLDREVLRLYPSEISEYHLVQIVQCTRSLSDSVKAQTAEAAPCAEREEEYDGDW